MRAIHETSCPNSGEKKLQLSCDGVSETKSTSTSIDVYSLCFKNCNTIYPHKLVRPLYKHKVDSQKYLKKVIDDITDNDYRITQFVGDNPKRSDAKECKCFSSWYPCEYCYAKGVKIEIEDNSNARKKIMLQINIIEEKINDCDIEPDTPERESKIQTLIGLKKDLEKSISSLTRKTNILWPASTMNSQHRSRNSILEIVQKIENNEELDHDESKGIQGRSLLLDLPYFNYVYDVPAEYLHSGCLGVIKRLVELTFDVGENRPRVTKRKLSSTESFNILMLQIKVVKEFPRRARKLDFAVFKGQEFRNISLFYFVLVIE